MKLKNKLKMFEEFASTEKNTETTINSKGVVKTSNDTTSILDDVDNILDNLETLSKQITEEHAILLKDFENTSISILENEETIEMVNEDFMAEIMKQVKSMKSYAKLTGLYPKMKKNILKAELNKVEKLAKFKAEEAEKTAGYLDQLKTAYKEKIAQVGASDAPAIKKSQKKEALRQQRDAAIEKGSDTVKTKLESARQKLTKQLDDKIRDLNTKLTDLQNDNKIEAELLMKQWQTQKLDTDDKIEFERIDKTAEIETGYAADNPEHVERLAAFRKREMQKHKTKTEEEKREKAEELAAIQAQFDEESARGTEEEKEAKKKIVDWFKAGNEYATYLGSVDFGVQESLVNEAEISDEVKDRIKELRKAYSDANAAVSVSTFKKAGSSEADAEEQWTTFKKMIDGAVDQYSNQVDSIDGIDDSEPPADPPPPAEDDDDERTAEQIQQEIDDLDQQITDKEADLDSKREESQNSEAGQEYARVESEYDSLRSTPEADRADNHQEQLQALEDQMDQIKQDFTENDPIGQAIATLESEIESLKDQRTEKQQELRDLPQESFNYENVTESFAFKSGSVADRFRRLI